MDLTIDDDYLEELSLPGRWLDPRNQESLKVAFSQAKLPCNLRSGERILANTKEVVEVPLGSIGLISLRSTFARMGLIAPPTVADPGFKGTLTMEVFNGSKNNILLESNTAIWSIHYLPFLDVSQRYTGKYQGQNKTTGPRVIE